MAYTPDELVPSGYPPIEDNPGDTEGDDEDPHVPAGLLEVHAINEWRAATGEPPL